MKETHWLWTALLLVILIGWAQYLYFRLKLAVANHRANLLQADLNAAREVLKRHPLDALEYVEMAKEACAKVK